MLIKLRVSCFSVLSLPASTLSRFFFVPLIMSTLSPSLQISIIRNPLGFSENKNPRGWREGEGDKRIPEGSKAKSTVLSSSSGPRQQRRWEDSRRVCYVSSSTSGLDERRRREVPEVSQSESALLYLQLMISENRRDERVSRKVSTWVYSVSSPIRLFKNREYWCQNSFNLSLLCILMVSENRGGERMMRRQGGREDSKQVLAGACSVSYSSSGLKE